MRDVLGRAVACGVLALVVAGCGTGLFGRQPPIYEKTIGHRQKNWLGIENLYPLGTLSTTADRRTIITRLTSKTGEGLFCAEPPPDAAENIAAQLATAVEVAVKQPASGLDAGLAGSLAAGMATSIQSLFIRSQGLQLYRDAMYTLCQSHLNQALTPEQFRERAAAILEVSSNLIRYELEKTNGTLGRPAPAPLPEAPLAPAPPRPGATQPTSLDALDHTSREAREEIARLKTKVPDLPVERRPEATRAIEEIETLLTDRNEAVRKALKKARGFLEIAK
jgi:hypothetical protein